MEIAIVKPYEDESCAEVFIVEPQAPSHSFKDDFEEELKAVKEGSPDEWQLDDVLKRMEARGWQILRPEIQTTVLY